LIDFGPMKRHGPFGLLKAGWGVILPLTRQRSFWVGYVLIFGVYDVVAARISSAYPEAFADQLRMSFYVSSSLGLFLTTFILILLTKGATIKPAPLVWGEMWRVFKANLLAGCYIMLGLICFVIPGLVLCVRYLYVAEVVVVENCQIGESLRRSKALSSVNGGTLLISFILAFVCYMAVVTIAGLLVGLILGEFAIDSFAFNYLVQLCGTLLIALFAGVSYSGYVESRDLLENRSLS